LPDSQAAGLAAVGASRGRVAVATTLAGAGSSPAVSVLQGRATRALDAVTRGGGQPFSLARAYLGDAAIATVQPAAIEVRVQRYFSSAFEQPLRVPIASGEVSALVATMDYRADVLLAWQQNGAIYARMLRASGRPEPTQRVAASAPNPQLQALVSDNDHGMIAWSGGEPQPASAPRTSVHIAFSGAGVRFEASRLLASFEDPRGLGRAPGSLALVRLSTENVMLAWTDAEHGHFVVRAAPAVFAGRHPAARLSDPDAQAVLADLAPGPAGEAVALWRSTPSPVGAFDPGRSELWTARTFIQRHGRVGLRVPEEVASSGANAAPSIAVDPASDHPVAAWLRLGTRPRIEYAAGPGARSYRPRSPAAGVAAPGGGTHWLGVAIAAAAAMSVLMALALRRRAVSRRGGGSTGIRRRR
jgi:hypothetical protein